MNTFIKQRGQILIIYLTTMFVGGSSVALGVLATGKTIKELEKGVKVHVLDSTKQQQSLALLERWEDEGKALKKEYKEQRKVLVELIKKHDANMSYFTAKSNELLEMDQRAANRLLDIQYDLRKNMTREEWNKVFSGG